MKLWVIERFADLQNHRTLDLLALGLVLEFVLLQQHSKLLKDLYCIFGFTYFYS